MKLTGAFGGDGEVPRLSGDGNPRQCGGVIMGAVLRREGARVNGGTS